MLSYPQIDPVLVAIGPIKVHWYGIMYLVAIGIGWWLARRRCNNRWSPITPEQLDDLVFYAAMGVVLGGRIGYTLFYQFDNLLEDPLWLFKVWEGGMSFHGGMLGVIFAMWLYARKIGKPFWSTIDFVAPLVPPGLFFGRLGNFINGELWGRPTDAPWGMVFPHDHAQLPRHPSQLYEAALEGLVLFVLLYWFSAKPRPRMAVSGLFLMGYGAARFAVEFVREPDADIGLQLLGLSRGQWLCVPMLVFGLILLVVAYRRRQYPEGSPA